MFKKLLIMIFTVTILLLSNSKSHAAEEDIWITVGYNYFLHEDSNYGSPMGPASLTVGTQVSDYIAFDINLAYYWGMKGKYVVPGKSLKTELSSFQGKFLFLFHPKFDLITFDLAPYIGIGPMVGAGNFSYTSNEFVYGFSAKAGLRFIEKGFLFGINFEYLYNHIENIKNPYDGSKSDFNASGFLFGAEIGYAF